MSLLFTETKQLREFVNINESMPFESIAPFVDDAQNRYLLYYMGQTLFSELLTQYSTPDSTKSELTQLLHYARKPLAQFALYMAAPEASIKFGDSGHTVTRTDKLAPASDAKIEAFSGSLLERAYNNLELMIQFMEENSTWYPDWNYTAATDFISTAEQFQEIGLVNINRSRLIFEQLRLIITGINQREIVKLLKETLYNTLKTNPVTDLEKQLLKLVVRYSANRAAAIVTSQQQINNSPKTKQIIQAIYNDMYSTGNYYAEQADYYWTELVNTVNANADTLGLTALKPMTFNAPDKKIFVAEG